MGKYDLEKNNRIQHPTFGQGTVISISTEGREDVTEIKFDEQGKKQIAIRYADLKKIVPEGLQDVIGKKRSVENFWAEPDAEDEHVHGDHWAVFEDKVADFLKTYLPKAIQQGRPYTSMMEGRKPLYNLHENDPKGKLLCYPGGRQEIKSVIKIDNESRRNELMSIFPFASEGVQHTLKLNEIYPWENGVEAQIGAEAMDLIEITFFDTDYVLNKGFYGPERFYEFILAGFAYHCRIDDPIPSGLVDKTTEMFEEMINSDNDTQKLSEKLKMSNYAVFVPTDGGDRDDYQFRGKVKKIDGVQMLGKEFLRIRTTVAKLILNEKVEDFDLDIYVNSNNFDDHKPNVGDDVAGILWLQGYLWHPGPVILG